MNQRRENSPHDTIVWVSRAADGGTAGNSGLRVVENERSVILALEKVVQVNNCLLKKTSVKKDRISSNTRPTVPANVR
jgi:hypothetical protein